MAVYLDHCRECGAEFENSHARSLSHCSVGCQAASVIDDESGDWVCPDHGYRVPEGEVDQCPDCFLDEPLCPNCCTPWKCNGPHLLEGAEVEAHGRPGTVRWVTPWASVAVVFEDGQMLWFAGEDVAQIGERE